jgi:hypothetical protein
MTRVLILSTALLPTLLGCSQSAKHTGLTLSPFGADSQSAGGLVDSAFSSGSMWPVTAASGLFLLAAIPAFFILDRQQFITLLAVGVILAITPVVLLRVLDHLVVPAAVITGVAGLAALVFFLGRLWDRWNTSKQAKEVAEAIRSDKFPSTLSDSEAAEAVESLAKIRRSNRNG